MGWTQWDGQRQRPTPAYIHDHGEINVGCFPSGSRTTLPCNSGRIYRDHVLHLGDTNEPMSLFRRTISVTERGDGVRIEPDRRLRSPFLT